MCGPSAPASVNLTVKTMKTIHAVDLFCGAGGTMLAKALCKELIS